MEQKVRLEIFGLPKPQGSKRHVGNGVLIEAAGEPLKVWRRAIAEACVNETKLTGPLTVEAIFFLPRPKSVKRPLPIVPPDIDKLARGLLDGIGQSKTVWDDDAQVIRLTVTKVYADDREPGASVTITQLLPAGMVLITKR